jgi:ectoine hydroxylase-related dioxygenase (phytanoyl-CoA dioxygenase family)
MLVAKCRKTLQAPVWPSLSLGDLLIFDYRILHRGRANRSNQRRNYLVLTYAEPWFQDVLNFPKRSMYHRHL